MSLPVHPSKRRRLDAGLSKPFRSPLRIDVAPSPRNRPGSDDARQSHTTSTADPDQHPVRPLPATSSSSPARKPPQLTPSSPNRNLPPSLFANSSPIRKPPPLLATPRTRQPAKDAHQRPLHKHSTALQSQLATLRSALDSAQQALKIVSSQKDTELETLVQKWRLVSREAAEELFRGAKDRVNRMGGVGAWRERTKERSRGWDDGDYGASDYDENLTQEQREDLRIRKEEYEDEVKRYATKDGGEVEVGGEKDDETFTMDMMLKSLNVELDLIGFDKESQRWAD